MIHHDTDETTTREVSDLLGEDGTVEQRAVRSVQTTAAQDTTPIDPTVCYRLRVAAAHTSESANELADAFGVVASTARQHLRGECWHHHDAPALEGRMGGCR